MNIEQGSERRNAHERNLNFIQFVVILPVNEKEGKANGV
jgi:hypothetical protein